MKVPGFFVYLTPFILALNLVSAQTTVNLNVVQCGMHQVRIGETKLEVLEGCCEPRLQETVSGGNQPNVQFRVRKSWNPSNTIGTHAAV